MATSSSICPRFSQNAWKKDLCSNCFKSKEEHKASLALAAENKAKSIKKTEEKLKSHPPPKGIIKHVFNKHKQTKKNCKVNFTKELTEVIGYGGSWSDSDFSDDDSDEDINAVVLKSTDDLIADEETDLELKRLTKSNTDFNMNNGNLLGDPEENIKKSFAALKLGAAPADKEGKKQTLKINVLPFGTSLMSNKLSSMKSKFESKKSIPKPAIQRKTDFIVVKPPEIRAEILKEPEVDGKCSPPIERAMERSLMDEISETLEKNKEVQKFQSDKDGKVKFEVSTQSKDNKIYQDLKKQISRNTPIAKDTVKPRINVFPKYQDSESSTGSDSENCISAYYDVIETTNSGYENVNDGKKSVDSETITYTSSTQFLTDILLSTKTRSASYNLHEGNFMTSKITNDGLIVTKCNSDDALDSTGSSFDGSSDEDFSYNMNKSESDSGIGITIGTVNSEIVDKKLSISTNNSDYEDIQVSDVTTVIKCRELAGEPDGSADPDGNSIEIIPALPKCSPPQKSPEVRASFLHGNKRPIIKPELPVKPINTTPLKTITKRQPTSAEQQVISQLQQIIIQKPLTDSKNTTSDSKLLLLKKSKAPNPPPESPTKSSAPTTPEKDYSCDEPFGDNPSSMFAKSNKVVTSGTPVLREKDKRERAMINPKFRSLNTLSNRKNQQLQQILLLTKPSTPEPIPRNKTLSMSEEFLNGDDKKKKNKFSIKKFLRMGTSKTTDNLQKKDGIYSEIIAGDEVGVCGKPRLVIIHPIDINQSTVEVVKTQTQLNSNEITNTNVDESISEQSTDVQNVILISKPPAPPHRTMEKKLNVTTASQHLDSNKPARPPPPKSAELRRKQKISFNVNGNNATSSTNNVDDVSGPIKCKSDTVYANLGEIRSSIAPRKPERTASMREREAQLELARKREKPENLETSSISSSIEAPLANSVYNVNKSDQNLCEIDNLDDFDSKSIQSDRNSSLKDTVRKVNTTIDNYLKDKRNYENIYDITKVPPSPPVRSNDTVSCSGVLLQTQVNDTSSFTTRSEYGPSKYGLNNSLANIPRVISASYCGSEMGESDIYSPYSYYGGSEAGGGDVADNDSVWGLQTANGFNKNRFKTTNRLRIRKGRSVVHKTIEDNYSAVVVANHEALAQVLDQLQQTPMIPQHLRVLSTALNLRFEDFQMVEGMQAIVVGKKAFHAAVWSGVPVTLALSADCNQISCVGGELSQHLSGGVSDVLNPITEFCDLVPNYNLPLMPSTEVTMLQSTITVLQRLQLDLLQTYGEQMKNKSKLFEKTSSNFRGSIPNLAGQKDHGSNLRNVCSVQNLSTLNEESSKSEENLTSVPPFDDLMSREVAFIMLQLINGMKHLQSKAIEEMPISLCNVLLCRQEDGQSRLCVLQGYVFCTLQITYFAIILFVLDISIFNYANQLLLYNQRLAIC
ncbi:hypothetical protein ACFFRR_005857 [Megaselia abdita]